MTFTEVDKQFMTRAIELAKCGQFTTTPNPNVGCVLVKNGEIVGEGFHVKAGEGHAEVNALKQAGKKAAGATAYVTLEPCSHYGRTPPCAEGLIKAGIKKVIAAMVDTNPEVSGRGLTMLNDAGVETAFGLLEEEARALNLGFFKRMEHGKPFVTCKLAASLDGKTALSNGESKWITCPEARKEVQYFRAKSCAILSGADTVLTDDARLTVRPESLTEVNHPTDEWRQPLRVIIDSQNRLTPELALFKSLSPIMIVRTELDDSQQWPDFVEQLVIPTDNGKVDLEYLLNSLAEKQINYIWLEAGATLSGIMHEKDLIDEYIVYLAPKIMGHDAKGLFNISKLTDMAEVKSLNILDIEKVGTDIRIKLSKD